MPRTLPKMGVYVHVPYCRRRCPYCDFAFVPVETAPSAAYTAALLAEISRTRERDVAGIPLAPLARGAASLYFGGGTPSMLETRDLARIVDAVSGTIGLLPAAEITLEANPEDLSLERARQWKSAGVNRLSLGVQAFDDRLLRALGREHDARAAAASVDLARQAGIENVSIDLIFGVNGATAADAPMTRADWEASLERAVALRPSHISCYGLTVERGTALARAVAEGGAPLPGEEDHATMYERAAERLAAAGYPRYEVSSFASREQRSVHNSLYWTYSEWLGLGPSSHSFLRTGEPRDPGAGGVRFWNDKNPFVYVQNGGHPQVGHESITGRAAQGEMAFTALRLSDGLRDEDFFEVFGRRVPDVFGAAIKRLVERGLVVRENDNVTRLTDRGYLLSDSVFAALV